MLSQRSAPRAFLTIGAVAAASDDAPASLQVRGLHKAGVIVRVWTRVAWLALRASGNPLRAATNLLRLRAVIQTRQWTTPVRGRAQPWTSRKFVFASGRYFWDLYLPGWPSAAFDRCMERELERVESLRRQPALNTVIFAITRRCALKCEHCVEWDVLNRSEALSADDLHEIVRRMRQHGTAQFFFSGGEPLQRFPDLLSLAASVSAESDVWVLSSGLGLTADKARRLRDAGVTGLVLSLDHWDATAHDRFRGLPGSFAAVERAARHALDAGLLIACSLCPTRLFATPEHLQRYAETARSLGVSFIQILEPKALGHYASQDVVLDSAQQRALEEFCERLNSDAAAQDYPTVEYIDWVARTQGCVGAGDRYAYIDTDGELHACPFCRASGLRVLDNDIDESLSILQARGCPATSGCTRNGGALNTGERPAMRSSS
jgi:MoaA/NifB/PqqE/SkfB family radical SAM enzyme